MIDIIILLLCGALAVSAGGWVKKSFEVKKLKKRLKEE